MKEFTVSTSKKRQVVDITDEVRNILGGIGAREDGVCYLFLKHTTAALTTAEMEPGTDMDLLDACEEIVPKLKYRHSHNPAHVGSHIMSAILGTSIGVPVSDGALVLGTWQRIVVVEFDGPRERSVNVSFVSEDA